MGFITNILPMNVFPLLLVILYEKGEVSKRYINFELASVVDQYVFLYVIAALLLFTLSYEMIKATMFAAKGSGTWVDFIMSFMLFLGIVLYIAYTILKLNEKPSLLILLVAEAQLLDVMVGFYLTITNARREFGAIG